MESTAHPSEPCEPRVWLLLGERAGDNAQVLALGHMLTAALGWRTEIRRLRFDPACGLPYPQRGASLIGLERTASDALSRPWPDIVIAIGQRAAPVARWIGEQARAENGVRSLLIHLGRPRMAFAHFDLIVTTPQYGLPAAENVVKLSLPFSWVDENELSQAGECWRERFAELERPWTAVLVGGPTPHLEFGAAEGQRLGALLRQWRERHGGSLLVTTSPRSTAEATAAIAAGVESKSLFIPFRPGAENPYKALLVLADYFVVTGDSASMMTEAILTGKPVAIFDLPAAERWHRTGLAAHLKRDWERRLQRRRGRTPNWIDRLFAFATRLGLVRPSRTIDLLQREIYERGWAAPLGRSDPDSLSPSDAPTVLDAERKRALARIAALWRTRKSGSSGRKTNEPKEADHAPKSSC